MRGRHIGHGADGIGKLILRGNNRCDSAFRQRPMPDITPAWATQRLALAGREWREVVMMHEALAFASAQPVDHLLVARGAQRHHAKHLSLSTREKGGAMSTRQ